MITVKVPIALVGRRESARRVRRGEGRTRAG